MINLRMIAGFLKVLIGLKMDYYRLTMNLYTCLWFDTFYNLKIIEGVKKIYYLDRLALCGVLWCKAIQRDNIKQNSEIDIHTKLTDHEIEETANTLIKD